MFFMSHTFDLFLLCFTYIFFMFDKCLAHGFMFDLCLAHVLHMFDIRFAYVFAYV
jgi:hypothetical protein